MKKAILTISTAVAVLSVSAQEKWSLRQCVDYAVENNISIRQTALTVESAEIDLNTSKNSRLPNLNASASADLSFGRTLLKATNVYNDQQSAGMGFGASSSLPVFQGMRINNEIKQDKLNLKAATENLNKAKENLELEITGFYLEVLFKKEILEVYREQAALSREQVAKTQIMVNSDKVARSQLYDIQAQAATDEVNEINAQNDLVQALLNLSQALNLEWSPSFDIVEPDTENVIADNLSSLRSPDLIYQTAIGVKPHVREAEYRLQSSEYQIKLAKSAYWPSIGLSASFGTGFDSALSGKNEYTIAEQLKMHREGVGLNMSIPIFNRNATRNSVRSARLNATNYSLQLENVKVALYKEIQQAYQRAVAAQARYDATGRALIASEESFRAMQLRYDNGKATVFEYNDSQTKLLSSQSEQLQSKYDFLFRAKILDFYMGLPIDI